MENITIAQLSSQLLAQKARWSARENPISLLSEDARKLLLGMEPPRQSAASAPLAPTGPAPAFDQEVDWRNRRGGNHISPVKNQASAGSCVSHCTLGVMEAMAHLEHGVWLDLSEADAHFCSSHGAKNSGWTDEAAFEQLQARGVSDEACFPYATAFPNNDIWYYGGDPNRLPQPVCRLCNDRDKRVTRITGFTSFQQDQARIKAHLTNVGPVSAGFAVFNDFYTYSSGVYHHVSGNLVGYHCVMIVGYSEQEQCWICKNSWGDTWGMAGYFKIAYGQCSMDSGFGKSGVNGIILPDMNKSEVNKITLSDTSDYGPAICQQGGALYLAWAGGGNNQLNVMRSADGQHFTNKVTLDDHAVGGIAIAAWNGKIYLAWTGTDARRSLNVMSSADGQHFGDKVTFGDTSFASPALAVFNNQLYIAWTGTDARHSLNIMSSADGKSFGNKITLADTSISGPALAVAADRLYLGWTGTDGGHHLNLMSSADGRSFVNKMSYPETSSSGPAISAGSDSKVWICWSGTGNLKVNVMPAPGGKTTLVETAIGTPAISHPFIAWTGPDARHSLNVAKLV